MSRDSFNDSIIMNNMGGGSAPNIELDLEPQDVIDTEFVEQVPPKKSRKKLFLALALAGVVIGGVAALQFPQVHALLEGNNQKLDLAALSGVEGGSTTAGNPFAMPEASAPQQDVVAAQLPAAPAPSAVLPDAATPQLAVVEAATSAPQLAPVALEDAAEAELLAAAAGSEPVAAAPASVQQVQQPQPAPQVVTETPVPAPVQAAVPAPAPDASPAPVSAQPAVAPVAPVAKVATPVAPASVKPAIETKKAPPAEPKKASAPAPRKNETAQRTKPAEPSSKEPETVRDVMVVTASQIGLRAFTDGQLVVSTGGRDAAYRVHDLLPSGELCILSKGARIEGSLIGPRAFILGEVEGDIEVQGTLVLAPSAVVVGKIRCGKFVVYDGASISGSIETIQSPTKQQLEQDAHDDARGVIKLKTGTR